MKQLRGLKAKKIREHNTRTKKMDPAARKASRKAFKEKVSAQFKQVTGKFPTARGLKETKSVLRLINQIAAMKTGE